jgi:hypothetical protein
MLILFKSAQDQQTVIKLKIKLKLLETEIKSLENNIKNCLNEIEKNIPSIIKKHHDLVDLLNTKKQQESNFFENVNFKKQQEKEKIKNIDQDIKEECKQIYKEIAKKCHPDICKDENLNNLFKEAVSKYEEFDLLSLKELQKNISTPKNFFQKIYENIDKVGLEIKELEKLIKYKIDELVRLNGSNGFSIFTQYNSNNEYGKELAEQLYSILLINENIKIVKELGGKGE